MRPWEHHAAPDWREALIERFAHVPRDTGACCDALRVASACVIRAWLYTYHRFTIVGRENVPPAGSFVMICNHCSHLDGLCLLSALPLSSLHRAFPAAAADYFFNSVTGSALSRLIINALPFHRDASVRHSLNACRALLDDADPIGNPGNVLILFPEGTRSTDGAVAPFRRGIGDLVAGSDVPVVPCYLDGAYAAWPKGTLFPRPRRLTLTIGAPRVYANAPRDKHIAQWIADELRDAVLRLGASHGPSHREDVYDVVCHH
jgi:1-acyl-sn-glycerol-3-phosphate acyltransferase